ncbi:MAG: hypothetical protein SGPRY_000990 [Prymnesium sp.]
MAAIAAARLSRRRAPLLLRTLPSPARSSLSPLTLLPPLPRPALPSPPSALSLPSALSTLLSAAGTLLWLSQLPPSPSSCDDSTDDSLLSPPPPPKLDDPEYNSQVLESWREKIRSARGLWSSLDVAGAEAMLKLAIEEATHFGANSAPVATSYLNLAQLYMRAGRVEEAEPFLERAAYVLEENAGPNNKVTLLALLDLASVRGEMGKKEAAAEGFQEVLERLSQAEANQKHGRQAIRDVRAGSLLRAGKVNAELGRLEQAESHFREAIELTSERWGDESSRLAAPCGELAQVLLTQGRVEEAADFCERAIKVTTKPAQREQLETLQKKIGRPK